MAWCAGPTALGGSEVTNRDHDGVTHQRNGEQSIQAGLELAVDLPAVLSLLSTLAPADGAAVPAAGAPDHVTTTLTDEAPTAEDGAGAPAAGTPDGDMTTVTDNAQRHCGERSPSFVVLGRSSPSRGPRVCVSNLCRSPY